MPGKQKRRGSGWPVNRSRDMRYLLSVQRYARLLLIHAPDNHKGNPLIEYTDK